MEKENVPKKWDKLIEFGNDFWNHFMGPMGDHMQEVQDYIDLNNLNRGRVLNCALVLEHMTNRYLTEKGLATHKECNALNGLSFSQKIDRIKKKSPEFSRGLIDGMKAINTIRNKYAHKLDYEISKELLARLEHMNTDEAISPIKPEDVDYAVKTLENYTRLACAYIFMQMSTIKDGVGSIYTKYPKLEEFFRSRYRDVDMFARD